MELNERLLLRPEEAARVLAIGRTTLYELLASGELKSVHIGTARRIPADVLRRFVHDLQHRAQAAERTVPA
jgi:excisionase family DNA binding protein